MGTEDAGGQGGGGGGNLGRPTPYHTSQRDLSFQGSVGPSLLYLQGQAIITDAAG